MSDPTRSSKTARHIAVFVVHGELETLCGALNGWHNVYRIDDYIGTHLGARNTAVLVNMAMPKGGHADYWKEPAFAKVVCEAIGRATDDRRALPS